MTLARSYPRLRPKASRRDEETFFLAIDCSTTQSTRWFFRTMQNMRNERSFVDISSLQIFPMYCWFFYASPCSFISVRFTKKKRKGKKLDRWKTERDAFRKISLLSRANISSPVTDVERTRDVQCIRSMTHFAREVTRTVPKLDLIDRLYYLALSTAFCSWNLNHAKIGGGAPSSVRYYITILIYNGQRKLEQIQEN